MKSTIAVIIATIVVMLFSVGTQSIGIARSEEPISLGEVTLYALVVAYNDLATTLTKQSEETRLLHRNLSPSMMDLMNSRNYAVDISDRGDSIVFVFDPKRIRQTEPIMGGSVKYIVDKKDFSFERVLIK